MNLPKEKRKRPKKAAAGRSTQKTRNKKALRVPDAEILRALLDNIADPIFVKDKRHNIIYGNQALSEVLGRAPEEYIGKNDTELFPKEQVEVFWEKDNRVFETGQVDFNEEYLTDSQGRVHVLSTKKARCMIEGHEPVIVGITRDITAIKEIEKMKSEFIAMISHELRTPLTSIHAALSLLVSGKISELPPAAAKMIGIAHKNSERLVRLVGEILDVEKIEAGMINPQVEAICSVQFLQQAVEENAAYGKKHGVKFELGELPSNCLIMADPGRLMQVVANLLSNAAKYSKPGGKVVLSARLTSPNAVCIAVKDFGAGIPQKYHDRVFDKFMQVDSSSTREHGGTGLGLTITKKLVEAMNGTICFESKEGRGSTFYVQLPAKKSLAAKGRGNAG